LEDLVVQVVGEDVEDMVDLEDMEEDHLGIMEEVLLDTMVVVY
jgi:hypothetical protein